LQEDPVPWSDILRFAAADEKESGIFASENLVYGALTRYIITMCFYMFMI